MTPESERSDTASTNLRGARILAAGERAPNFTLSSTPDQRVSLDDFRGQPVVLAFYPADWSPVCGDQMALYNQVSGMGSRWRTCRGTRASSASMRSR